MIKVGTVSFARRGKPGPETPRDAEGNILPIIVDGAPLGFKEQDAEAIQFSEVLGYFGNSVKDFYQSIWSIVQRQTLPESERPESVWAAFWDEHSDKLRGKTDEETDKMRAAFSKAVSTIVNAQAKAGIELDAKVVALSLL